MKKLGMKAIVWSVFLLGFIGVTGCVYEPNHHYSGGAYDDSYYGYSGYRYDPSDHHRWHDRRYWDHYYGNEPVYHY